MQAHSHTWPDLVRWQNAERYPLRANIRSMSSAYYGHLQHFTWSLMLGCWSKPPAQKETLCVEPMTKSLTVNLNPSSLSRPSTLVLVQQRITSIIAKYLILSTSVQFAHPSTFKPKRYAQRQEKWAIPRVPRKCALRQVSKSIGSGGINDK